MNERFARVTNIKNILICFVFFITCYSVVGVACIFVYVCMSVSVGDIFVYICVMGGTHTSHRGSLLQEAISGMVVGPRCEIFVLHTTKSWPGTTAYHSLKVPCDGLHGQVWMSTAGYTFTPCVVSLTCPGIEHQIQSTSKLKVPLR